MRKRTNSGRKRKAVESRHSTPSMEDLFAGMGEPGKPAPKAAAKKSPASH